MCRAHLIMLVALCAWAESIHACQGSPEKNFDVIAPTATDIIAVQIEALSFTTGPFDEHDVRSRIRVLRHYRGAGNFTELRYVNTSCVGLRIDIGGIYLIAVDENGPSIDLTSRKASILQLSGSFPVPLDYILRAHPTVQRLESALRGDTGFEVSTSAARIGLVRELPPPPVPPPEDLGDEGNR